IKDEQGNIQKIVSSLFLEDWGFEIIDHQGQQRQRFFKKEKGSRDSLRTTNFWVENSNTIWFGSDRGLLRFDTRLNTYQFYNQFEGPIGTVWSTAHWKGKLFVSTFQKGILTFDLEDKEFTYTFRQGYDANDLRQNSVYELYLDPQDVLWASLWHIGLDYASLHKTKFAEPLPAEKRGPIMSLIEGPQSQIWCTKNRGFLFFNQAHQLIEPTFRNPEWNRIIQRIGTPWFFKDRLQRIWLSIGNELYRYVQDDHTFALACVLADPPRSIIALSNGRTLVSTNEGVFELKIDRLFNVEVNSPPEFSRYAEIAFEVMHEDPRGLVYFSKNSQSLLVFRSDQDSLSFLTEVEGLGDCKAFLERSGHDSIWICTEAAVIALDRKTFGYRALLEASDGLPAELYYCMIQDAAGKIWLSGNKGIVRYNPSERNYHRYTRADGLQSLEFNTNAYRHSSTGDIWLGGTNGINVFDPLTVAHIPDTPQIQITNLLINDEPYVTDTYIGEVTELSLDYKHNTLSFEFVGLEFSDPKSIQYKYIMVGFDDDWVESGTRSFARYPNLPSGDYQFEVIAANSDGVWNTDHPRILKISINPPFTQTVWFYMILILLGGTVTYLVYRFQLKRRLEIAEKKRLRELDELKNRLYTNITHEFRTPLTLIHGPVSQALSSEKSLDKKELRNIYRQSERLQHLIDQILELQKAEAGKLRPHYVCGEVVSFVRYLFDSFELLAKEKSVTLVFFSVLKELGMDYDEEKLTQILSNLISNAVKHTHKGGKVSLTLSTSQTNDHLHIRIQDTGVGISPDDLPYIFDRYYQSSRAATGGTGIGLALTKNLVELLGGSVTVESVMDFGTTFNVELPITTKAEQAVPVATRNADVVTEIFDDESGFLSPTQETAGKPIVLVVEDHTEVLEYIVSCLAQDFTIMTSMDGNDGIRKAYEHIPDLIVSDIIMPGKDGFELCTTLKVDIQTSHIPIILLTGRRDQASLMEGIEHGADAYIVKPFHPQELILRVKKLLELRANLRQYYRKYATAEPKEVTVQASAKENEFLHRLRTFVEDHMNDAQFNMQMLSHKMAMSHSQLHRKITALTGESTGKFVRTVRLTKAMDLLRNSDLTVSEIAYETGFSEPGYFTKVFSKEYHMSPSEYRSQLS
ncbi:MAG TPA: ATP-binding protein, partial [Saprospiraceae bacterium]|nr:ATP-binding protein [Saprospiraceae bacterium]